jgi:transcriptional regulator with XRE-family HTH domain
MGERAVKHVRKFLGQRLRALRKQRGLRQERLGDRAGLSGKFIGEVERGEKSISIDSLYRVSVALEIPLRDLTDVRADKGLRGAERRRRTDLRARLPPPACRGHPEGLSSPPGDLR